jgi:carbonic anhydrase
MNRNRITRYLLLVLAMTSSSFSFAQQPAPAPQPSAHAAPAQALPSADRVWADLVEGNKRFVSGKTRAYSVVPLRAKLASGQQPNVIVLSCSDSRVPPELVFDQSLGDIFTVRTAGNVDDPVAVGSIEYAIAHIHSPLLVVMGHQKCGAVTEACSGDKEPSANLQAIVDKIDPAVAEAKTHAKSDELIESAVKENVHQTVKDLLADSAIIRDAVKSGKLTVVEAEYQLSSGEVIRLNATTSGRN